MSHGVGRLQESKGGGSSLVKVSPGVGECPGGAGGQGQAGAEAAAPEEDAPGSPSCSLITLLDCPRLSAPAADLHPPAQKSRTRPRPPPAPFEPMCGLKPQGTSNSTLNLAPSPGGGGGQDWGSQGLGTEGSGVSGLCLSPDLLAQAPTGRPWAGTLNLMEAGAQGQATSQTTGCSVTQAQENPGLCHQRLPSALLRAVLVLRLQGWPAHEQPPRGQLTPEAPSKQAGAIS